MNFLDVTLETGTPLELFRTIFAFENYVFSIFLLLKFVFVFVGFRFLVFRFLEDVGIDSVVDVTSDDGGPVRLKI